MVRDATLFACSSANYLNIHIGLLMLLLLLLVPCTHAMSNERWVLSRRPSGKFRAEDLRLERTELGDDAPADGNVLVQVEWLSIEAFYRTTFDEEAYHGSTAVGSIAPALGVGTVLASGSKKFKPGARVVGMLGAQTLALVPAVGLQAVAALPGLTPTDALGRMGISGLTAWVGVVAVLRPPRKGEVVVVSAAAGGVGSIAAQIAKARGARVIGIAGGRAKARFLLNELHLDGAVDYKGDESVGEQLDKLAPEGVDFFFDNVGGGTLDVVLARIRTGGRIVVCGAVSQYSEGQVNKGTVHGPRQYLKLAERGATMKG